MTAKDWRRLRLFVMAGGLGYLAGVWLPGWAFAAFMALCWLAIAVLFLLAIRTGKRAEYEKYRTRFGKHLTDQQIDDMREQGKLHQDE